MRSGIVSVSKTNTSTLKYTTNKTNINALPTAQEDEFSKKDGLSKQQTQHLNNSGHLNHLQNLPKVHCKR